MFLQKLSDLIINTGNFIWSYPLLILLLGGGLFFLIYSRFLPFLYIGHAFRILSGRYDNPDEPGQISPYQALSTAISGTVGMGNVSGIAVGIVAGGPGAVFWMWVSAFLGAATEFFTNSLGVLYRGKDSNGEIQGGPMYVITEGLGKNWKFMAIFFSFFGMIGVTPMFQANQLTQAIRDIILVPNQVQAGFTSNLITGILLIIFVVLVITGGIKRIGKIAAKIAPIMIILYILAVLYIILSNPGQIIQGFKLIFIDAFSARAAMGGAVGSMIITGVRRASFSNEAGIGTTTLAHGAAKTNEPIRQGLIGMLGPFIDTIIVCTMTALAIIITGFWNHPEADGITLTAYAFNQAIPGFGPYLLIICVSIFALTTLFAYPYYGAKCFSFIFGTGHTYLYYIFYIMTIMIGALGSLRVVISIIDSSYGLMAFPTMITAIWLAPKVMRAAREYFKKV